MPAAPELDSIVLIVEDEALIRVALADFLQDVGFKVLEAANANEAVEIIEKASVPIDLVFTDVRMPGTLDGIELAHWIRTSRPQIAVIVVSGDMGKAHVADTMPPADHFLCKPYDLNVAAVKIRHAIANRRAMRI